MDQLKALRVFTQVAELGSFARAARGLGLAPAVVTRSVAELEAHLGARLLNRTTRRVALTDVGADYLARARRILGDVDEADAMARAETRSPSGIVRLRVPPAVAVHQLAKHLPRLRAAHPGLTLEVDAFGPVESASEAVDLSIVWTRQPLAGDVIARRLARAEVVLCAAPEYLDARGRPSHPDELAAHDVLLPPIGDLQRGLRLVQGDGLAATVQPGRAALSTGHVDTNYAAALAGLGIVGLPSFVVADALLEHALERVLPHWHLFSATLWATLPSRAHLPARTRVVLDFLLQVFGGEDRDPWLVAAGCATPPPG